MKSRIVHAVAGILILTSIGLAHYVHANWMFLGIFVGLNLLQSAVTKFSPLEKILNAVGIKN